MISISIYLSFYFIVQGHSPIIKLTNVIIREVAVGMFEIVIKFRVPYRPFLRRH